ncbi:MAG TPA: hypothetical protein VM735_07640, partial [Candidatus Kapabacteria bacterium]|nr:hypothetical protein [Candidatus Kapabacteria bacterium]
STVSLMPEGFEQTISKEQIADLLSYLRSSASPRQVSGNKPEVVKADREGAYMLSAMSAEIYGDQITFEPQFRNIGLWHSANDSVNWSADVKRAGLYEVYLDYACASGSAGNRYQLSSGTGVLLRGEVAATGEDWSHYKQTKVGEVRLEPGMQRVTFRPEGEVRGALIDVRTIALVPAGHLPKWPSRAASSDEVLRDVASVARFILDSTRTEDSRETAVKANPQFSATLIAEMTRDLVPGTPEEYVRIPWIWRVAIACGRRNDAGPIKAVLAASLPKQDEPLRDWQAVVIGGGIINGISQRGVSPAPRIEEIIGADRALKGRWNRALQLAATMADNPGVQNGTRYDALRMLGVEPWDKRGGQLAQYLSKDINAELQMGAVSGLVDMHSRAADQALIAALSALTEHNRNLALDALVTRDSAADLLRAIDSGKIRRNLVGEKHRAELLGRFEAAELQYAKKVLLE